MEKFEKLTAIAAPMPLINIDTDMIIPKTIFENHQTPLGSASVPSMRCATI